MNPQLIPDHQKKTFLKSLSEDEFRDQVVRRIYILKGMRRGKDTCGTDEEGKDCYLYSKDALRDDILYCIQTKKGDVKMTSKASDNLLNIVAQLRTALETPVHDAKAHKKAQPDCVLLVASGEINTHAQKHIVNEIGDPRIQFRDADDLIPEIDQHMPAFWQGIDTRRIPYLKGFREYLINQSDTIDMTQIGVSSTVASPITDDTFVQLFLHRYQKKLVRRRGEVTDAIDVDEFSVTQLLQKPITLALIIGDAGSGKTTSLRRLGLLMIDHAFANIAAASVPVYLRCIEISRADKTLSELAADITSALSPEQSPAFNQEDLVKGGITLLIDGYDELSNSGQRQHLIAKLKEFNDSFPRCRMFLTSRESPHIGEIEASLQFVQLRITPINLDQAGMIIDRISKGKQLSAHTSQDILRRLDTVHGIDLSPLLVTVFVATTDFARTDIPANITELFKKFSEMMLGRWDQSKGLSQQYQSNVKDHLLQQIAFDMHSQGITTIGVEQAKSCISDTLTKLGLAADIEVLFSEISRSGLLRFDDDELSFRHFLLQEFFAGRGIPSREFMCSVLGKQWWMRAIIFHFGERPGDEPGLLSLPGQLVAMKGTDLYQAAVTVGLALQACYLTSTTAKHEVMEWVIHSMAETFQDVIDFFSKGMPNANTLGVVFYYLYGRDSVSVKIINDVCASFTAEKAKSDCSKTVQYQDRSVFWCIAGLIGIADMKNAEEALKHYRPDDLRLLLPLMIGCIYLERVQVADKDAKKQAARIASKLGPIVKDLSKEVVKEMKGILLEIRGNEVKSLDGKHSTKLITDSPVIDVEVEDN